MIGVIKQFHVVSYLGILLEPNLRLRKVSCSKLQEHGFFVHHETIPGPKFRNHLSVFMLQLLSLREGKRPSELDADSNVRPLLCPLDPPPPLISDAEKGECLSVNCLSYSNTSSPSYIVRPAR